MFAFKHPIGCEDRSWFSPPRWCRDDLRMLSLWVWYRVFCKGSVRYTQTWIYLNQDALNFIAETQWDEGMRYICVQRGVRILDAQMVSQSKPPPCDAWDRAVDIRNHDEAARSAYFAKRGVHSPSGFRNSTPDESFEPPPAWGAFPEQARADWISDQLLSTNLVSHTRQATRHWANENADVIDRYVGALSASAHAMLRHLFPERYGSADSDNRSRQHRGQNWRVYLAHDTERSSDVCVNRTGIPEFSLPRGIDGAKAASWTFYAIVTLERSYGNDDLTWVDDNYEWIKRVAVEFWDISTVRRLCESRCAAMWPMLNFLEAIVGKNADTPPDLSYMGSLEAAYVYRNKAALNK